MDNLETREISKELNKPEVAKNNFQIFKTLCKYLFSEKKKFIGGVVFSLLNSIFYIVGSFLIGYIVKNFFEPAIHGQPFNKVGFAIHVVLLTASFLIYGLFRYLENYLYTQVSFNAGARLRNEIIEKLHKLPIGFYDKNKAGDLISTLIVDVNNVANSLFQMLSQVGTAVFSILISVIVMFLISSSLSLIIIPVTLILFGLIALLMKKSQPYFIKVQNSFGELNAFVEEMLSNTQVTKAFNQQEFVYQNLQKITKKIRNEAYGGDVIAKSFETWYGLVSNLAILMICFIAALFYVQNWPILGIDFFGAENGKANASLIVMFISLCWNYIGPFQSLLNSSFSLQVGIASSARLFKLLDIKLPDKSNETIELTKTLDGNISFKNVYFKYLPESRDYQLKNATFQVKKGQTVAIVGPTGAGKTTIISLLSKYYDYQLGNIKIDGMELKNIKTSDLRDNLTIVLQDSFLFNQTILENLKLANPKATEEEIINAAKLTEAHHFIMSTANGYHTMIENNGANISQGQKQLLALTRAILQNKAILILDEATSNIDSNTEKIVQKAMLHLMKDKTSFVIAHRLSTIQKADLIIVVDNGYIIEQGTHQELLDKQGFYYDLFTSQF
ncbi:ABC transporter ATP-binding protein [Mycoplasmopsis glycophila]|uniref:ABC-type multidrug/protein/lipid transport system ATPase component n=1 Tax=Mycoplasmopsis glycophila TaxID=171285 RepID=A0A449AUI1_9BACT|nr:ABC transporter ATP-binding protein [Mycoplasmopsis glycophila]VEU70171.1 ABC-type multidrug/protein/lipid transport system ATPase component [Mycoplasmopsis glycophila]